ncbi:NAD(P)/FAD-dependent oxidoreductase [Streptomyces sp. NRRL F-5126]|uniref:NAD(P)/FAD-dependent oxidoreductase n=1 Tax=Streptomyces sp. NRRL F-5126 TaxID=1463857 RepID=UPI00068B1D8A|nr:FAD-dependent oxidoreductase [Streptomyces sp. NRRL F-5126]
MPGKDGEGRAGRDGTLIVGASQAGLQLAVSLRQLGDTGRITLVGEEAHAPYQRPPLSKEFLAGAAELDSLAFRAPSFYADNGIDLVCGERITAVRPGLATTASGRTLPHRRLALTTGASPRRLRVPGADLAGVHYLRDHDDAAGLRGELASARRVVVVGGGFIGLEAASVARAAGRSVTVVEAADRLLGRAVTPLVSEFYARAHRRRGVEVLLSAGVAGFEPAEGGGRVGAVVLGDGSSLAADLVLVGVGAVPRTELAEQLGLACEGGIVVDAQARTSDPAVVAAGDCTVQPHPVTGEGLVRIESVQNAVAQAQTAAATLLGRPAPAGAVPWFWSFQGDLRLQIAGLSAGHDTYVVRGDVDGEHFSVLYYRDGRLLAVDAVNRPADYMAVRKALTQGATVPPGAAADGSVPLKSLITRTEDAAPAA